MAALKILFINLLWIVTLSAAQAQDNPTIAVLRLDELDTFAVTEGAILDVLASYGFISAEENALLHESQDLVGENITIIWDSADFDLPTANLMIERAIDQEPDVLLTLSTPVTQLAVNATLGMENPPALLFASVYNPVEAGII